MQILTLTLDPVSANALIANLQVAIKVNGWEVARTAVPIIDELLRQDAEFKASQAKTEQWNQRTAAPALD
jgi:hypothetical protein